MIQPSVLQLALAADSASILGCDISGWQPANVNFTGMGFVYVKSTEGLSKINANHDAQCNEARRLGLVVGHYHFPAWGDPVAEARAFFGSLGWRSGEFLVLDIENSTATPFPEELELDGACQPWRRTHQPRI
jgi:GH25 family lysozyme M1 (1,4-beta-N-acetylmuramidase)